MPRRLLPLIALLAGCNTGEEPRPSVISPQPQPVWGSDVKLTPDAFGARIEEFGGREEVILEGLPGRVPAGAVVRATTLGTPGSFAEAIATSAGCTLRLPGAIGSRFRVDAEVTGVFSAPTDLLLARGGLVEAPAPTCLFAEEGPAIGVRAEAGAATRLSIVVRNECDAEIPFSARLHRGERFSLSPPPATVSAGAAVSILVEYRGGDRPAFDLLVLEREGDAPTLVTLRGAPPR